jgi:hypothetical protein
MMWRPAEKALLDIVEYIESSGQVSTGDVGRTSPSLADSRIERLRAERDTYRTTVRVVVTILLATLGTLIITLLVFWPQIKHPRPDSACYPASPLELAAYFSGGILLILMYIWIRQVEYQFSSRLLEIWYRFIFGRSGQL